ncbi:MAG: glutaredoxin domain-containing protein [Steroidobacteraceae bacterium]
MATPRYRVYWQPGCTSCLRVKEFLSGAGIPYDSINVREHPEAAGELAALGVRAVPVVARGREFVLGQDLDEVAHFVGVEVGRARLEVPVLVARLIALLDTAAHLAAQIPAEALHASLPGRRRTHLDLAYHVSQVAAGFLDAAAGGRLTFEHFERKPPGGVDSAAAVSGHIASASRAVSAWWLGSRTRLPDAVDTYYGRRSLHSVLERTTWHVAQHARQLEALLLLRGAEPHPGLAPALLDGLPLPQGVWDAENTPG